MSEEPAKAKGKIGFQVLQLNIAHTSWFWVHRAKNVGHMRFGLYKGRLLLGKKHVCVGLNLADLEAQKWIDRTPEEDRRYVRTAKVSTPEELELLEDLPCLEALELSGVDGEELLWVANLNQPLKFLSLSWCDFLRNLDPIKGKESLVRLVLSDNESLADISALTNLTELRRLDIINCDELVDLEPLAALTKLRRLVLRNCENIRKLKPISQLPNLVSLDLSRSKLIDDVEPLSKLDHLVSLDLSDCDGIRDVSPLQDLKSLRELHLFGCDSFRDIRPLYNLPNMRKFSLPTHVGNGELLGICVSYSGLEQLDLRNCRNVDDLSPLSHLENLKDLSLAGCKNVSDIGPIAALEKLVRLDMAACPNITDLSPLESLENLKDLYIGGCRGLSRDEVKKFRKTHPKCEVHTV